MSDNEKKIDKLESSNYITRRLIVKKSKMLGCDVILFIVPSTSIFWPKMRLNWPEKYFKANSITNKPNSNETKPSAIDGMSIDVLSYYMAWGKGVSCGRCWSYLHLFR